MFVWVGVYFSTHCLQQQVLLRRYVSPLQQCSSDRDCEMPGRSLGEKVCEKEHFVCQISDKHG